MLDVSLAIAAGGKAFGVLDVGDARPVLLMALEDGERRLKAKAKVLYGDRPLPELFHYLTHIEPGRVMETVRAFTALHVDNPPLIVLDTLGKAMPVALPGESAYQRDYRVGSGLKRCVDALPGSALVIVHHDRKAGSDDFVDSVSGTHGLAGACDTVIVINRPRHEDKGVLKITGRDIAEAEYAVKVLDGIRWQLDGADLETAARTAVTTRAQVVLGDRNLDVLAYVNDHPGGVTPKEVEEKLGYPDARRSLFRLADAGRIRKTGRGRYEPLPTPPGTTGTLEQSETDE